MAIMGHSDAETTPVTGTIDEHTMTYSRGGAAMSGVPTALV
jgi:hypothetical protein